MNQPAVNGGFAPQTLFLGLAASSLASSFLKTEELSARSFLLWGLPAALGLCLLSALLAAEFQARELFSGKGVFSRLGCGVSGLWFAVELIRTVRTAQEVCWSQFSSMAALSVLPLLLWAGWALPGGRIGPILPGTLVAGRAGGSALCSGACRAAALAEFISGSVPFYRGRFWADTLPGIFRMDLSLPAAAVAQGGLDAAGQLWGAGSVLLWNGAFIWRTAGERPARL